MAKPKVLFTCSECGWQSPKWLGQCRECQAWGSLEEETSIAESGPANTVALTPKTAAQPVTEVDVSQAQAFPSGMSEFDRVLGRGVTPGAVILFAGAPGVGKSTLLLDIAARYARMSSARKAGPVLYATGEESASQVRLRADRIGALTPNLLLTAENDLNIILGHIRQQKPALVIVDSVQTLSVAGVDGAAGGVNQVKAATAGLIQVAKEENTPVILVGHVTKEGSLAGPRTLEHLVDVVCQFEGDRHTTLRLLRSVKNRYGATDEVGCFQLTDRGIEEVPDPSELFMTTSSLDVPGSCITVTLEGNRPMTTEIQALVAGGGGGFGRRTVSGVEPSRVAMVLAVLQAHLHMDTKEMDVYVSTVGGAKAGEPSSDLATALAIISALKGTPLPPKWIALGEVGLTGDVRGCSGLERRLQEAARLGFKVAIIPDSQKDQSLKIGGMELLAVQHLAQATKLALSK